MPSGLMRSVYTFNGGVVAQRESTALSSTLVYLHSDHLGSVSMATNSIGGVASSQEYDPWGVIISGGVGQTTINYTGQRLDATGLLYYHARYYDPSLGKFLTPDSIAPGASIGAGGALGTVGDEQNSKLTVDFHEAGFATSLQAENQQILDKGFWFQLSGQDKQRAKEPWGPANPQALNRYSYVLNNPLRYTDPSGHIIPLVIGGVVISGAALVVLAGLGVTVFMLAEYLLNEGFRNSVVEAIDSGFYNADVFMHELADAVKGHTTMEAQHGKLPGQGGLTEQQRRNYGRAVEIWKQRNGYGPADHDALSYDELMRIRDAAARGARADEASRAVPDVDEPDSYDDNGW